MKERPILFSGPMVRAILRDPSDPLCKVETRRVVKLRDFCTSTTAGYDYEFRDRRLLWNSVRRDRIGEWCPYGAPGKDRLWVKETHAWCDEWLRDYEPEDPSAVVYHADGAVYECAHPSFGSDRLTKMDGEGCAEGVKKWRSAIYMPRWASRLDLAVEFVRVERLHDIDDAGARREGVADREAFRALWCDINGAESRDANPWVWVVGFRRVAP